MKKFVLAVLLMSLVLGATGCGYQITEDSTVTVIRATPTPEPTATPEPTPTPVPVEEVDETVEETTEPEIIQTELGVNVVLKDAVYVTNDDMNVRKDCSASSDWVTSVPRDTQVTSTGVSEDGEWVAISYNGYEGFIKAEYMTLVE